MRDIVDALVDALSETRRERDRWRDIAAKLKQAVEIQTMVYTPDGFMSLNGREAIQQFNFLDKQDIEE
jgi:peptidyl-tRNA hydrolase